MTSPTATRPTSPNTGGSSPPTGSTFDDEEEGTEMEVLLNDEALKVEWVGLLEAGTKTIHLALDLYRSISFSLFLSFSLSLFLCLPCILN
jgi:hypothetical protein